MKDEQQGNPKADDMFGSDSGDFFNALESDVNGAIQDDPTPSQATPEKQASNQAPEAPPAPNNENVDWQKRYQDSSREAQRLNGELTNLKPFLPVLNAMRNDTGLVDHVREYLISGGKPSEGIAGGLKLPEDFQFEASDLGDSNSDSSKVLQAQINEVVNKKVSGVLAKEKQDNAVRAKKNMMTAHEADFKKRHKMDDASFDVLKEKANKHILTLDDVFYILNRDKSATNVANNAKQDMIKQMETVNKLPGTQAAANSQGAADKSPDSELFDQLLGVDQGRDNLFG